MPYCTNCGQELSKTATFCTECGCKIAATGYSTNESRRAAGCPLCGENDKLRWNTKSQQWICDNCGSYFSIPSRVSQLRDASFKKHRTKRVKKKKKWSFRPHYKSPRRALLFRLKRSYRRKTSKIFRYTFRLVQIPFKVSYGIIGLLVGLILIIGIPSLVMLGITQGFNYCNVEFIVDSQKTEIDLFNEVNNYREIEGLSPLVRVDFLGEVAREHSEYMVEHGLSHSGFDNRAAVIRASMPVMLVAENCIDNPGGSYNAHGMAQSWYESPGHRANMLNPAFKRTGVGVVSDNGHVYATQIFTD